MTVTVLLVLVLQVATVFGYPDRDDSNGRALRKKKQNKGNGDDPCISGLTAAVSIIRLNARGKRYFENRSPVLFRAQLAQQIGRYEDMATFMKSYVEGLYKNDGELLNLREGKLLSVAYKHVVGARRTALRGLKDIISTDVMKDVISTSVGGDGIAEDYKKVIERELEDFCNEVLKLLDQYIIKSALGGDKVFYLTMKGDYCRYKAGKVYEKCKKMYEMATELAQTILDPASSIRLGLALSFSEFYFETLHDSNEASRIAREAYDNAIPDIDQLENEELDESSFILARLDDNLTFWNSDQGNQEDDLLNQLN